jgi:hypothetical protein
MTFTGQGFFQTDGGGGADLGSVTIGTVAVDAVLTEVTVRGVLSLPAQAVTYTAGDFQTLNFVDGIQWWLSTGAAVTALDGPADGFWLDWKGPDFSGGDQQTLIVPSTDTGGAYRVTPVARTWRGNFPNLFGHVMSVAYTWGQDTSHTDIFDLKLFAAVSMRTATWP